MRRERAKRYAGDVSRRFRAFVLDDLFFRSFADAQRFYRETAPQLPLEYQRYLGANDRYWLLTQVLGRIDAIHPWVYDRAREVELEPDDVLDLWARGHYKSTLGTLAGTLQEIVDDPEITICIYSMTDDVAEKFVGEIGSNASRNASLHRLFPDVFWANPRKEAPVWSKKAIVFRRAGSPKEATVEGHGLLNAIPTGSHFRMLVYDDIINEKVVTKTATEQIKKAWERFELSRYTGVGEATRRQYRGTRYLFGDTYGQMIEKSIVRARVYPATEDGTLNGKPVFLSPAAWEKEKKANRATIAAQMLQNPLAGAENTFRVEWLRPFIVRPRTINVYIMVDPSLGRKKTSDRTAMSVVAIDANGNRYLCDGYCHRMSLSERWTAMRDLRKKWAGVPGVQLCRVGYERYGLQSDLEYFEERMNREKNHFEIVELNWVREGEQSKEARVGRLEPYFRNNQFFLPGKVWHPDYGGTALWEVRGTVIEGEMPEPGGDQVLYRAYEGQTREEKQIVARGERYRIQEPIRRVDQDGNIYDLFRSFVEEYAFFPFSTHRDLIDATSRVEDLEPVPPRIIERSQLEPRAAVDF